LFEFDIPGLVYEGEKLACGLEAKNKGETRKIKALRAVGFGEKEVEEFMEIVREQIKAAGVKKEKKIKPIKVSVIVPVEIIEAMLKSGGVLPTKENLSGYLLFLLRKAVEEK